MLSRQEIIALVNSLNQLAASVKFASHATDLELTDRLESVRGGALYTIILVSLMIIGGIAIRKVYVWRVRLRYKKEDCGDHSSENEDESESRPREVNVKKRSVRGKERKAD